ncbi:MAG: hypothetical protein O9295_20420 [Microcystis sp. LE18-22.4A]|jgi:hypothetical protein|uniref:hypothetical protein n=1 Tax=Microcystis sp. LE18-22.4A TaxID=3016432 RepID=UPI0022C79084|nr:hypothetical protein [Microcystis sp. LE18-22.4A]MCZ8120342.1 hypothetical protein [Microcystis sp. LE18-22.4A]
MSLECVLVEYKESDRAFHLIFVEEILKPKLTEELALKIGVDLFNGWVKEKIQEIEYELSN